VGKWDKFCENRFEFQRGGEGESRKKENVRGKKEKKKFHFLTEGLQKRGSGSGMRRKGKGGGKRGMGNMLKGTGERATQRKRLTIKHVD